MTLTEAAEEYQKAYTEGNKPACILYAAIVRAKCKEIRASKEDANHV